MTERSLNAMVLRAEQTRDLEELRVVVVELALAFRQIYAEQRRDPQPGTSPEPIPWT